MATADIPDLFSKADPAATYQIKGSTLVQLDRVLRMLRVVGAQITPQGQLVPFGEGAAEVGDKPLQVKAGDEEGQFIVLPSTWGGNLDRNGADYEIKKGGTDLADAEPWTIGEGQTEDLYLKIEVEPVPQRRNDLKPTDSEDDYWIIAGGKVEGSVEVVTDDSGAQFPEIDHIEGTVLQNGIWFLFFASVTRSGGLTFRQELFGKVHFKLCAGATVSLDLFGQP